MKRKLRAKLTYANVMVTILAFIVLGGSAAFAAGQLAKNSVGARQLKRNAVTTAKVKKGAITGAKIKLSSLGAVPNANQLGGIGAAGYQKTASWALIKGDGTSVIAQSGGISIQAHIKGGYWLHFPGTVTGKAILATLWEGDEAGSQGISASPCGFQTTQLTPDAVQCVQGTNTKKDLFVHTEGISGAKVESQDISFYVAVLP